MPVPSLHRAAPSVAPSPATHGTRVSDRLAGAGDRLAVHGIGRATAAGALALVVAYLALLLPHDDVVELTREDGIFESLGALALFACAAICAVIAWRGRATSGRLPTLVLSGLVVVFFVGGAEEISWGQRIFGLETPDRLADVNRQEEITLHNIEGASSLAGPLFNLFWLTFGVLVPMAAALSSRFRALAARAVPVLPVAVGALLLANYALLKVAGAGLPPDAYHGEISIGHATTEIMEALAAVLLAVGLAVVLRARARAGAPASA